MLEAPSLAQRLGVLLAVPGLGIVKAGFVLQLMGYDIGCLDTRNVQREGRNPREFRTDGKPPHMLAGKVSRYIVETGGRAQELWDIWCADVAETYGQTPYIISQWHIEGIVPDNFIPF